ncbi:unnamed protein product [Strongylus vulgaris]|uniref:Uncharacterized protein n=1 Tax=Strongylus vulgaris TaxID=40348 RepID=A0A3P7I9E3_STRVU|nr:unnamed protein product [Strongylus vulgaris]
MQQIAAAEAGSTTFSNPVYDLETDSTEMVSLENTPSTSRATSFRSQRTGDDVIAPNAELTVKPAVPPRPNKAEKDKNILVENPVFEANPDEISDV